MSPAGRGPHSFVLFEPIFQGAVLVQNHPIVANEVRVLPVVLPQRRVQELPPQHKAGEQNEVVVLRAVHCERDIPVEVVSVEGKQRGKRDVHGPPHEKKEVEERDSLHAVLGENTGDVFSVEIH